MVARVYPFDLSFQFAGYRVYYRFGNSLITRVRHADGSFEPELVARIISRLEKESEPVLLDVGANLGLITLAIKHRVPKTRVYAFEPGPVQSALLRKTIRNNGLGDTVSVIEAAASDAEGIISFFTHAGGDEAKDGIENTGRGAPAHRIEVRATTLDLWAQSLPLTSVSVIKIDTEGAELLVLRGARGLLKRFRPYVYFELDLRNLKAYPHTAEDIMDFFLDAQYSVMTLDGKVASRHSILELMRQTDTFVAYPENA